MLNYREYQVSSDEIFQNFIKVYQQQVLERTFSLLNNYDMLCSWEEQYELIVHFLRVQRLNIVIPDTYRSILYDLEQEVDRLLRSGVLNIYSSYDLQLFNWEEQLTWLSNSYDVLSISHGERVRVASSLLHSLDAAELFCYFFQSVNYCMNVEFFHVEYLQKLLRQNADLFVCCAFDIQVMHSLFSQEILNNYPYLSPTIEKYETILKQLDSLSLELDLQLLLPCLEPCDDGLILENGGGNV